MTTSTGAFLQEQYSMVKALGDKAVSSDATFVIDGFEHLRLICKQFPWPILSPAGEIAIPMPMGSEGWQPQQLKINQQGAVSFVETIEGHVQAFATQVAAQGAKFNATVYEGTLESHKRGVRIRDAFVQFDNPDRDWENRGQALLVTGTMFFHFFGETIPGNQA
ncbi:MULTISPECIES: hypothetical protein [Burkholderia cepacia complex]|jgi:hypothetical protein|uniref:hypothetical protein n=1 Tax=Burkholderia cepacia complex TaxID=87882 RepID=UPI00158BDC7F|nr:MULTISPECIES: hypothetical protein [Burkholderia cepacia complex]MCA8037135.1 hypothetical protein [Burkholderia arboris]